MKHLAYLTLIALLSICTILTFSNDDSIESEVRIKNGNDDDNTALAVYAPLTESTLAACLDGVDNDGNGLIDTEDKTCISLAYDAENEILRTAVLASTEHSNWDQYLEAKKSQNSIPRISTPDLAAN